MKPRNIVDILHDDVREWLLDQRDFFTNERDMQVKLARFLMAEKSGNYDLVDTEYRVPLCELRGRGIDERKLPWNNQISVDIVVRKGSEWACVELKYHTQKIDYEWTLFGEPLRNDNIDILKNQAASDIVMYNYLKDVRRIEAMTEAFGHVAGGLAVIVSNCNNLWNQPTAGVNYEPFSLHDRKGAHPVAHSLGGHIFWGPNTGKTLVESYPAFDLSSTYPCRWEATNIVARTKKGIPFQFMITTINQ